jgi:hypothetical protein
MKFKSIRLVAAIALVTTLSAFAAPPAALKWDSEHKQATLKAGEVDAKFEFTATNTTKDEISISALKTSCGCTAAQLPTTPYKLAPGSNVTISVAMNIAGKQGQITKTVTVESSAGSQVLLVSATAPTETKTETK